MHNPYIPENITYVSRELRKNMTNSEKTIWEQIKNKKLWYKFLSQRPIYLYTENSWLDRYIIPDFNCLKLKLILEIDWNIHNVNETYILDNEKEKLLSQKWYKIIRITNNEIENNITKVLETIVASFP